MTKEDFVDKYNSGGGELVPGEAESVYNYIVELGNSMEPKQDLTGYIEIKVANKK